MKKSICLISICPSIHPSSCSIYFAYLRFFSDLFSQLPQTVSVNCIGQTPPFRMPSVGQFSDAYEMDRCSPFHWDVWVSVVSLSA